MENYKYIHQGKVWAVLFTHPDAKRPTLPQILLEILEEILLEILLERGTMSQIVPLEANLLHTYSRPVCPISCPSVSESVTATSLKVKNKREIQCTLSCFLIMTMNHGP